MPGLLRGVARTAVVAGTASAVSGRVQRRQAERFADRDAQIAAQRQQAYQEQVAAEPPPTPRDSSGEVIQQLRELGELKAQGVLTDEEFAAQKRRILGA
jgi:hypothetical protein